MKRASILALVVVACTSQSADRPRDAGADREAIANTMQRYMVHARTVNGDSMAAFFTTNGTLFEPGIFPIVTRDSIRSFMKSFPGVRVDSATAVSDAIEVFGDTALLWGTYFEKLSFPGQPQSEQDGKFVIEWIRQPDSAWQIHRYYRIPLPATPRPQAPTK